MRNIDELREKMKEVNIIEMDIPEGLKINLGCGLDYRLGYVNVDTLDIKNDVKHDLETYPWPIESDSAGEILASHLLEHVIDHGDYRGFFRFFKECHRILKPNGIVKIRTPNYTSIFAFGDPGHRAAFSINTFFFLSKETYQHNAENKTQMTQYPIDFDFKIVSINSNIEEITVVLRKVI